MKNAYLFILFICLSAISFGQVNTDEIMCFECHSDKTLVKEDNETGLLVKLFVDPEKYKKSIHKNLTCTDCHSEEFEEAPHPEDLKKEEITCLNCHDDGHVFKFETIQTQIEDNVHFKKMGDAYNCFVCHDQHSFYISARYNEDVKQTVAYDNSFCLNCHLDENKDVKDLNQVHEFLPHKERHWSSVRCIDCHAKVEEGIVSHFVGVKETAVRTCNECHSTDSRLLQTLYQFQAKQERNEQGFFNGVILNNSYVIGATRNFYFNLVSVILLGLTIVAIFIHLGLRLRAAKGGENGKK